MNDDGHGRRVFDGVMSHVAGAGKVFANHRFGMPGRTATQHEDRLYPENWFPFGNAVTTDPFSRKTGAILQGRTTDPLVIETNSSTEYWQKGASLVHTDPTGRSDADLPANVRVYMIAGTQHGGRPGADPSPGPCINPRNPHSATPALRALFLALEEWVTKGTAPPPGRVPRVADGTAVPAETIRMPAVPGFAVAPYANQIVPPVDWVDPPVRIDNVYGALVCAVDADGNEIAGIRLPPIAVPLGTHTGWNVYRAQPDELADRDGSFIAFARTKNEREAAGDPRPSLEERYGSREAYVAKVRAAAASARRRAPAIAGRRRRLCHGHRSVRPLLSNRGSTPGAASRTERRHGPFPVPLDEATAREYVALDCSLKQMSGIALHRRSNPILLRVDSI